MLSFIKFNVIYFLFYIFFTYNIKTSSCNDDRKLTHDLNPGCNSTCGQLVVITALGSKDKLYHVWDFDKKPTFLMAEVSLQTELKIDWDNFTKFQEKSISFSTPPSYIFGIVINKVYEFNDIDDSGTLQLENKDIIAMDAAYFNWTIQELIDDIPANIVTYSFVANGYQYANISKGGRVAININAFGNIGHAENLPHLLHTENSSLVEFIIDNFTTSFSNSRFAVEFVTFSSNGNDSKAKLSAKKTIDDENTPGVFVLDTLIVEDDKSETNGQSGFLQWRPIVYTSANKVVANSTKTWEYDIANVSDRTELNSSLLYPFFGSSFSEFFIKAENISFGSKNDGFFAKTNFSSWSFVIGVGMPPEQPFSMLVFLVIAIGLGFPTLVIMGGTAFMIYKRIRSGN